MDSQLYYFPDPFATLIHAPVPHNAQAFDVDAIYPFIQPPTLVTFPTPSELMVDLASASHEITYHHQNNINVAPLPDDLSFVPVSAAPHHHMALGMPTQMGDTPVHLAAVNDAVHLDVAAIADVHVYPTAVEPARRPRRRATTTSVTYGSTFVPTDPDSISSHEKKRHYLECIEQYIQYLHDQFELLGERPPDMERVASYRGLSSRSIRTLLVHMEHNTRKLSERTRDEEQRFLSLRNEVHSKESQ